MSATPDHPDPPVRRTPLYDAHIAAGARMVPFAGWEMPIQYDGVVAEHTWCRTTAALFDVAHMAVVDLLGDDPTTALERLTPAGITTLDEGRQRYLLLTNDAGGIIDDAMVAHLAPGHLRLVVNAGRRDVDVPHLIAGLPELDVVERTDLGILALQGPEAAAVMVEHLPTLLPGRFLDVVVGELDGATARPGDPTITVSRSGYTGEDGVEIIAPAEHLPGLAELLLADERVAWAGLGARDTLRLEAGLCLYGNDLDEGVSPVEAGLVWSMPRRRREAGDFPGAERIRRELADGPSRVRVGLRPDGRRPVRDGAALTTIDGIATGVVTSGGFGPTVGGPVAMGFVRPDHAEIGTPLVADVRGKTVAVTVAELPFVPARFAR